jgi:hypothetical protein
MKVLEALAARPFQHFVARLKLEPYRPQTLRTRSQTRVGETTQIARVMILITLMSARTRPLYASLILFGVGSGRRRTRSNSLVASRSRCSQSARLLPLRCSSGPWPSLRRRSGGAIDWTERALRFSPFDRMNYLPCARHCAFSARPLRPSGACRTSRRSWFQALALLCKTGAVVLGLSVRNTLFGDATRNLYRRDNVALACRVDVLRVVRNVLQTQAHSCASVADARPRVSGRINWRRDQ